MGLKCINDKIKMTLFLTHLINLEFNLNLHILIFVHINNHAFCVKVLEVVKNVVSEQH